MTKQEHVKYWVDSAIHDLDVAEGLFHIKKYDWTLFIAHLVLEKLLKAIYVMTKDNEIPPKTHNLLRLAEESGLVLSDEQKLLLDKVNDFNLEARYPDYKSSFSEKCTFEYTSMHFSKIKEVAQWLQSQIR